MNAKEWGERSRQRARRRWEAGGSLNAAREEWLEVSVAEPLHGITGLKKELGFSLVLVK